MNLKLLLIVFLSTCCNLFAQNKQIDSLKIALKTVQNDTIKCNILSSLVNELYNLTNREKDWSVYHTELRNICKNKISILEDSKIKDFYLFNYANCLQFEASVAIDEGNYSSKVLELLFESEGILKGLKNEQYLHYVYGDIARYYQNKNDFVNSLIYYNKVLLFFEKTNNNTEGIKMLNNIAGICFESGKKDLAIKYFKEALVKANITQDKDAAVRLLNNIGSSYQACKIYDSSIVYLNKSISIAHSINHVRGEARALNLLSSVYFNLKNYKEAVKYSNQSLELCLKNNLKKEEANNYIRSSEIWQALNNLNKAEGLGLKGLTLAREINDLSLIKNASFALFSIYKAKSDFKNALDMREVYHSITDSINNNKVEKATLQFQLQYEYGKKAIVDSLKTVKDKEVYSIQIEKDRNQKTFLYIIIFLIIIFTLFIFNRYKVSQVQKKQIQLANESLENANNDLNRQHLLNQKIFSVISHDFRGPILSLTLMLESFKTKSTDKYLNQFVNEVNAEVLNASEMLNNLLNWARTEISIKDFEKQSSLVSNVYNETIREFDTKLKHKSLLVEVSIPQDAQFNLPPDILKITLRNLLSNAIKFSYANNLIKVIFDVENEQLDVIDFGVGINKETLEKLFKQEVDTGLGTNNEEGFGMGLYLLSELLRKYGYTIIASNELAGETRFSIITK